LGQQYYYRGEVELKRGVTFPQIKAAWLAVDDWADQESDPDEDERWPHYSDNAGLTFEVANGLLGYHIDEHRSLGFGDIMEAWLKTVAVDFAAKGWASWEDDEAGGEPVFRGADQLAIAHARVDWYADEVIHVQKRAEAAKAELLALGGGGGKAAALTDWDPGTMPDQKGATMKRNEIIMLVVGAVVLTLTGIAFLTHYSYTPNGYGGSIRTNNWNGKVVVCGTVGPCNPEE
jgi:hypothetical protein